MKIAKTTLAQALEKQKPQISPLQDGNRGPLYMIRCHQIKVYFSDVGYTSWTQTTKRPRSRQTPGGDRPWHSADWDPNAELPAHVARATKGLTKPRSVEAWAHFMSINIVS